MDIELKPKTWYEITLTIGKKFTAFHKDGELVFTDGSTKLSGAIIPFAESMVPCESPGNVLHIVDFLPDLEEE
ncbi:MAG: hypothetical protein KAR21_24220 [Spirochaetales bacterium]|nr:hypothetical protein [Spirochaetales bacterium]